MANIIPPEESPLQQVSFLGMPLEVSLADVIFVATQNATGLTDVINAIVADLMHPLTIQKHRGLDITIQFAMGACCYFARILTTIHVPSLPPGAKSSS